MEDEQALALSMATIPTVVSSKEDEASIISMAAAAAANDNEGSASASNSITIAESATAKRPRSEGASSAPTGQFKGVVRQQNGHFGAQIYAQHLRIWLGTFKSERAAAMAYDSAAIKLHGAAASHRNFPPTDLTALEPAFQELFTTEAVLDMIKDGSYESKFAEFIRVTQVPRLVALTTAAAPLTPAKDSPAISLGANVSCKELFQKELTPSDVGKLNRLVIPKKNATKHLPAVAGDSGEEQLLEFRDREGRVWAFRYCYWKSSQSFVFTKGWNKFVKDKGLRAKDVVGFYRCEEREGREYCMIDIVRNDGGEDGGDEVGGREEGEEEEEEEEEEVVSRLGLAAERKRFKLFGAVIG